MLIEKIHVRNFRSLRDATLECDPLTAILGRNGTGKSSVLHALDYFYRLDVKAEVEDFYDHSTDEPIEIMVTYGRLSTPEREEFDNYIGNDELTVLKRFPTPGTGRYYAWKRQVPEFAYIRRQGKRAKTSALKDLIGKDTRFAGITTSISNAEVADQVMDEFEMGHPELTQPTESEDQFFGPPNIGGGKLDKFTRFILVPAVRDAAEEAEKKGMISQLIDMIVLRRINLRTDVQQL